MNMAKSLRALVCTSRTGLTEIRKDRDKGSGNPWQEQ